jgi:hypothetical protein
MILMNTRGFDDVIKKVELYYGKVIEVTNDVAIEARKLILKRIEEGKNSSGKQMRTKSTDKYEGDIYSRWQGEDRADAGLTTSRMTLKYSGGLYNNFTYRKNYKKAQNFKFILQFYVKNGRVPGRNISYGVLAAYHEEIQGDIFKPTKGELNKIGKLWKKQL